MLLPAKHTTFAESLLGFSSFLLELLTEPLTIDQLWARFEQKSASYPAHQTFDNMLLAVSTLYAINSITTSPTGEIKRLAESRLYATH